MSILCVHSDVRDAASHELEEALRSLIENANGMFAYVLGNPDKLEDHCRLLISDYLTLGKALAPLTERYLTWNDPNPEDLD